MKKFIKAVAVVLSVMSAALLILTSAAFYILPDEYTLPQGDELVIGGIFHASCASDGQNTSGGAQVKNRVYEDEIELFNIIPVKKAKITKTSRRYVYAGGNIFGIRLYTSGVIVVGMQDVLTENGEVNPAKRAGLAVGDVITHIGGKEVNTNSEVMKLFEGADGKDIEIVYVRGEKSKTTSLRPEISAHDGKYKAGIWVRDSTAGLGTMTYYDEENNVFAGLGHGICDVDTGEIMPLLGGDIVEATVSGIKKGEQGVPGELCGAFSGSVIGELMLNTKGGIFGTAARTPQHCGEKLPVAAKQEVTSGKAYIISTIDGKNAEKFSVEIKKLRSGGNSYKNMIVKVTDERLISMTGGIVQGMSGSPIIKDGMLVGAVTHVFVNDPLQGYGIFAENMAELSSSLNTVQKEAS